MEFSKEHYNKSGNLTGAESLGNCAETLGNCPKTLGNCNFSGPLRGAGQCQMQSYTKKNKNFKYPKKKLKISAII